MTGPTCGTPHYSYPESLCTEPAGHYIRDRDPHAAPLIIDGRQCGGLAWDEPEHHMPDRIPLDHLTSDALDQLYDQLDALREAADWTRSNYPGLRSVNDRFAAALTSPTPTATEATERPHCPCDGVHFPGADNCRWCKCHRTPVPAATEPQEQ